MCACIHAYMGMYLSFESHSIECTNIHTYTYTHIYIHTYIHEPLEMLHQHTYTYTYIHTYTYVHVCSEPLDRLHLGLQLRPSFISPSAKTCSNLAPT